MNIYEKLMGIQQELKAPKGNFNNFGKYKYRSAEDILEAVKPLLAKYKTLLLINDEVKAISNTSENKGRYYVEATVTLIDVEKGEKVSSKALAREEESKKGMDGSQVTGGASSYARKYALSGMFAIDDTKDMDTMNNSLEGQNGRNVAQQPRSNTNGQQSGNVSNLPRCSVCGDPVKTDVANFSLKKYGKVICYKDQQEMKKAGVIK